MGRDLVCFLALVEKKVFSRRGRARDRRRAWACENNVPFTSRGPPTVYASHPRAKIDQLPNKPAPLLSVIRLLKSSPT